MAKQKALSTQLKEASLRIEQLEKELKNEKSYKENYQRQKEEYEKEIESVHSALDAMFVPRQVKVGYSDRTMTIASRLFAWQAGARIENVKREVE